MNSQDMAGYQVILHTVLVNSTTSTVIVNKTHHPLPGLELSDNRHINKTTVTHNPAHSQKPS